MSGLDLRPLSLGEILDRTFTLYRGHFVLFLGIVGIPHLLLLAVSLTQILMSNTNPLTPNTFSVTSAITGLALVVASIAAYLFSQGGAILAVSQIYLGRPVSIAEALGRVWIISDSCSAWSSSTAWQSWALQFCWLSREFTWGAGCWSACRWRWSKRRARGIP